MRAGDGSGGGAPRPRARTGVLVRPLPWLARYLHTYVSLLGFAALVFFSLTGLTLNHAGLLEGASAESELEGNLPNDWVQAGSPVDRLAVVEWLRRELGVKGHLAELEVLEGEVYLSFKGAGYSADVEVVRESGGVSGYEVRMGLIAFMNDLHKGRGTGSAWSWAIDASAVLLTLSGLTGIWLLWHVRRRRVRGLLVVIAGAAALALVVLIAE